MDHHKKTQLPALQLRTFTTGDKGGDPNLLTVIINLCIFYGVSIVIILTGLAFVVGCSNCTNSLIWFLDLCLEGQVPFPKVFFKRLEGTS